MNCLILLFLLLQSPGVETLSVYVAPTGNDKDAGTRARPFATLVRAREAARTFRSSSPKRAVSVFLRSGTYRLDSSFVLSGADSGDSLAQVTYRSFEGEEARLIGGRILAGFRPVTDQRVLERLDPTIAGKVFEADLGTNGVRDYGVLRPRGFGKAITPAALELFCNDSPMTLARWPNQGWTTIADTIQGARDSLFVYDGERPLRWSGSKDIWIHGYWTWDWADSYVQVDSIDLTRKTIRTKAPHGVYGYSKGKRYYVLNVLEELDSPGEFYIDREKGLIYFWPPVAIDSARVVASMIESPLIVMNNARWITISGLVIECTRGAGVEISGGDHCRIAGCSIRNIGTVGVSIGKLEPKLAGVIYDRPLFNAHAGYLNGVQSSDISSCGEGGVILCGGDRATLTPERNYVDNCDIADCTRWVHTYRAGIFVWGVGNRVSHNRIHNLPHTAVFFWGNDHQVEYNEVYEVCRETGDAGAFYQGRDWTQRGNVIRGNYIHDLKGVQGQGGFTDVMGVYMDDFASGTTVRGNIFKNSGRSVMIGGGRDNFVENNVFIGGTPAIHVDARGRGWAKFMVDGENSILYGRLKAIQSVLPLYQKHYPQLSAITTDEPALPKGNIIRNNISWGGKWRELLDGVDDSLVAFVNNTVDVDPGFVSPETGDYRLRGDAQVLGNGFKQIPTGRIGLYKDSYRSSITRAP